MYEDIKLGLKIKIIMIAVDMPHDVTSASLVKPQQKQLSFTFTNI
jgi:hypothetical protein